MLVPNAVVLLVLTSVPAAASVEPAVSRADAFVSHDDQKDIWTIGNESIAASFAFTADHELKLVLLAHGRNGQLRPSGVTPSADTTVTLNGRVMTLVTGATGLSFAGAAADTVPGGVHLTFTYLHESMHARVVRHYACYPRSPTIETWTHVEVTPGAAPITVSDLTGWELTIPLGTIRWINGLRGDAADTPSPDAFSLGQKDLAPDELFSLSSYQRSSEQFVPFVMIDGPTDEWYGGVQWSGAWRIACVRHGATLNVTLSYPDIETSVSDDHPLDVPHAFFGVAAGGVTDVPGALQDFINLGIRQGRPFPALVTYNTWYAYGTRIDEQTLLNEINQTASLGIELFVVDAGWYPGAGTNGTFDFETGLGRWIVDPDRFPNGLAPLVEFVHASGMKFGLWVEPARVSLETVGQPGLADDAWLAQRDGRNVSESAGKICLGSRAAREWVWKRLTQLIDEVQPDYLKWDSNGWLNCNRTDHDHGPEDGNFAQVSGLYTILQALRDRYPTLLIENVSAGGSRIDFGWLRYSDAAWVDDRTEPSVHVRHNLEGLSAVFPPAYLLSFIIDGSEEPLIGAPDLPAWLRSRMLGILGFSHRSPGVRPSISGPFAQAILDYRSLRDILTGAQAILLTDQAESPVDVGWDVLEELNAESRQAVIFAFLHPGGDRRLLVRPRGLSPDATYDVRSLDAGALGSMRGDELMARGIEIVQGDGSAAHVLILTIQ